MDKAASGFTPSGLSPSEKTSILESIAADVPEVPEAAEHIAFVLNDMLLQAEKCFGGRLAGNPLEAILFAGDHPVIKNPSRSDGPVHLYLSMRVLFDLKEKIYSSAYWTMAHEGVHLLSRPDVHKATVLEEGIACWFQKQYTKGYVPASWSQTIPSYIHAKAQFAKLLSYDTDIVKKLRQVEPTISLITADMIQSLCPDLPIDCARALSTQFVRGTKSSS